MKMVYSVFLKKSVLKRLRKLPVDVQKRFDLLHGVLKISGPTGPHEWKNYSKLDKDKFHCHLGYHHAACWQCDGNSIEIEVYYVGSRESAPY